MTWQSFVHLRTAVCGERSAGQGSISTVGSDQEGGVSGVTLGSVCHLRWKQIDVDPLRKNSRNCVAHDDGRNYPQIKTIENRFILQCSDCLDVPEYLSLLVVKALFSLLLLKSVVLHVDI